MLALSGHQGIVKTKRFQRDTAVWFAGIDRMVEEVVKGCLPCQAANHDPKPVTCVNLYTCPSYHWVRGKSSPWTFVTPFQVEITC